MLIGFLAGNMGGVYRIEAAAHAAGAYDEWVLHERKKKRYRNSLTMT